MEIWWFLFCLRSPIGVTQNLIGAFSHRIVVSNEKTWLFRGDEDVYYPVVWGL